MDAISVIIPVAPGSSERSAVRAVESANPGGRIAEILAVEGAHPSRQRNLAARMARGHFLYFIDHDSIVETNTVRNLLRTIRMTRSSAVGGPNVGIKGASRFGRLVDCVLASPIGSPLVYRRYSTTGTGAPARENNLILCNLMVEREVFLRIGGFDPRLYPNEENEFLNRLNAEGHPSYYTPDAAVRKARKYTLRSYISENFRYGRGRMEQIWVSPYLSDAAFLALPAAAFVVFTALPLHPFSRLLAAAYAVAVAISSALSARKMVVRGRLSVFLNTALIFLLILMRHASYGMGLIYGMATGWRNKKLLHIEMSLVVRKYSVRSGAPSLVKVRHVDIGCKASKGGKC